MGITVANENSAMVNNEAVILLLSRVTRGENTTHKTLINTLAYGPFYVISNKIAVVIYLTFHFISNSIIRLENEKKLCFAFEKKS